MGARFDFEEEKLIVGVIYSDRELMEKAIAILVEEFGEIEDVSEEFSFSKEFSDYYDEEMGEDVCTIDLDEDEYLDYLTRNTSSCPYYKYYDEYKSVQKQN